MIYRIKRGKGEKKKVKKKENDKKVHLKEKDTERNKEKKM